MKSANGPHRQFPRSQIAALIRRGVLVAAFISSFTSTAAAIRYQFSGEVDAVAPELASKFSVGEAFRGSMWIDPTPRTGCSICLGDTYDISQIRATIGGDYALTSPEGSITIINDLTIAFDFASFGTTAGVGMSAPSVGSHFPDQLHFSFHYADLASTELLSQFVAGNFLDHFGLRFDVNDDLEVEFTLNDFSVVPEPSAARLACLALPLPSLARARRER
jgi:hypothetical protein